MKLSELDNNVNNINTFLLDFKRKLCSNITITEKANSNIVWKLILNNRNSFNIRRCYAKTESGHQCKRMKGYCNSIFCGLHYSGKGAHIRKRNETIYRFYEKDNQTILTYTLEFTHNNQKTFNIDRLLSVYLKNEKYYIDSYNGNLYNINESGNEYIKIGNINSNNFKL